MQNLTTAFSDNLKLKKELSKLCCSCANITLITDFVFIGTNCIIYPLHAKLFM